MSNKQYNSNWNTVSKKNHNHYHKKNHGDDSQSQRFIVSDEFKKELSKNEISVDKWYHKLLTGEYYKANGVYFYEEPILKRLANEYQKALHLKNIDAMILIKNELFNHMPEPVWINKYLTGEVCDNHGKPLKNSLPELAEEYMEVYNKARESTMGSAV